MDEDREKLFIMDVDGRTNQRCVGVGGAVVPANKGSQQVRTMSSMPLH